MEPYTDRLIVAFSGQRLIARGSLVEVVLRTKDVLDKEDTDAILLFDDETSQVVEVDFRGTADDVARRLPIEPTAEATHAETGDAKTPRSPGRPKLGVVAREVTLLPRHWEWLAKQPGGASVTLRRLVEAAKRTGTEEDLRREAREAAYRFMSAMAGNEEGYEESSRALFAGNRERFEAFTETWPPDVRGHARELAGRSFDPPDAAR